MFTLVWGLGAQQVKFARLTEIASGSVYSQQAKSSQRLLLYPLAFIIFWIPATTNRYFSSSVCGVCCTDTSSCPPPKDIGGDWALGVRGDLLGVLLRATPGDHQHPDLPLHFPGAQGTPVISIYFPHDWPTLSLRRTSIVAYEDSPTWPQKGVRASTPLPSSVLSLVWLW